MQLVSYEIKGCINWMARERCVNSAEWWVKNLIIANIDYSVFGTMDIIDASIRDELEENL